jgi:hypothetical protein
MHQGFNVLNERNRCVMESQQISAGDDGTLCIGIFQQWPPAASWRDHGKLLPTHNERHNMDFLVD